VDCTTFGSRGWRSQGGSKSLSKTPGEEKRFSKSKKGKVLSTQKRGGANTGRKRTSEKGDGEVRPRRLQMHPTTYERWRRGP